MEERGEWSEEEMAKLDDEIKAILEDAWEFADASPDPALESLHEDVLVDTTSDAGELAGAV
jgi:pyruvate dehydrogenase E1 component alpha subunit